MKLLLENWRKYINESKLRVLTLMTQLQNQIPTFILPPTQVRRLQ